MYRHVFEGSRMRTMPATPQILQGHQCCEAGEAIESAIEKAWKRNGREAAGVAVRYPLLACRV